MDQWNLNAQALVDSSIKSRDTIKSKLKNDWNLASAQTMKLTETTNAVHRETVRIIDGQMAQMDGQLVALDDIISRVREQNEEHHKAHATSLEQLASNVQESYESIGKHFETSYNRTQTLEKDMRERTLNLRETTTELEQDGEIRQHLHSLRDQLSSTKIEEYASTGETPAKTQYSYPTTLPRTETHEVLLDRMRGGTGQQQQQSALPKSPKKSPKKISPSKLRSSPTKAPSSPTKPLIFADTPPTLNLPPLPASDPVSRPQTASSQQSLRELDVNVAAGGLAATLVAAAGDSTIAGVGEGHESKVPPNPLKRHHTNPLSVSQGVESKLPLKKHARMTVAGVAEGRENVAPLASSVNLSASVGPGGGVGGRRLRSRGSD